MLGQSGGNMGKWISHTQLSSYANCPFGYFLGYVKKLKMPKNANLVTGSIIHELSDESIKSRKLNEVTGDSLRKKFQTKLIAESRSGIWAKDQDTFDKAIKASYGLLDLLAKDLRERVFPFTVIDCVNEKTGKKEPASEVSSVLPLVDLRTGELLVEGDVRLYAIIDRIGIHDTFGLAIVDDKTAARDFSYSKVHKDQQLFTYAYAFRHMLKFSKMFPDVKKEKEDKVVFRVYKKTKEAEMEIYDLTITDEMLDFFMWNLKETTKGILNGPYCINVGQHCDFMCSYKPICDAIVKGGMSNKNLIDETYNKFMLAFGAGEHRFGSNGEIESPKSKTKPKAI
jgi:hypothetical protein